MKPFASKQATHQAPKGKLLAQERLADYTSLRVGGFASQVYLPTDITDLANFIVAQPEDESFMWLGLGSNTLIRDGGFEGTVIVTQGVLNQLEQIDNTLVRAQAGVSCATLARFCARLGLRGAEFLAGIPGTVGGALNMNAGCAGAETWEIVHHVETLDAAGFLHKRMASDYQISYRKVEMPAKEWFVAGYFNLLPGDKEESLHKIKTLLAHRTATQPTSEPNCGSVFRNPPGDFAGRLIEACGLKGLTVGGALVSRKHANFIVNTGTATAEDIETLIRLIIDEVASQQNVHLVPEVHMRGNRLLT